MKNILTFNTFITLLLLITTVSCSSRSGKLAEQREISAIEAKIDAELETQKQIEIERGYDAIIIEYATATYKVLNDTVAVRVEDDVFFHKRKANPLTKGSPYRYYRVF